MPLPAGEIHEDGTAAAGAVSAGSGDVAPGRGNVLGPASSPGCPPQDRQIQGAFAAAARGRHQPPHQAVGSAQPLDQSADGGVLQAGMGPPCPLGLRGGMDPHPGGRFGDTWCLGRVTRRLSWGCPSRPSATAPPRWWPSLRSVSGGRVPPQPLPQPWGDAAPAPRRRALSPPQVSLTSLWSPPSLC